MDTTQRHIWNTVKHLRWNIFRKKVEGFESLTTFAKRSILDVWQGSEYDSVADAHLSLRKKLIQKQELSRLFKGRNI